MNDIERIFLDIALLFILFAIIIFCVAYVMDNIIDIIIAFKYRKEVVEITDKEK